MNRDAPLALAAVLRALYASEINVSVSSFWDGGWRVKLGDDWNGFDAEKEFRNDALDEAASWLVEQALALYPDSVFAKGPYGRGGSILV